MTTAGSRLATSVCTKRKCFTALGVTCLSVYALLGTVIQSGGILRYRHFAHESTTASSLHNVNASTHRPRSRVGGSSRSTEWLDEYHNFTGDRCERLLAGDIAEQQNALRFVKRFARSFWCHRDDELAQASCELLRRDAYGGYTPTADEIAFPLAYSLRVHTCATQVELLLRAIYVPHNFYCIHVDGGAKPSILAAMRRLAHCMPNVQLAPVRDDFVYKSVSQMEADMECMDLALQSPVGWRYFLNLAGQELPLKSNYELVQELRALNGSSHISVQRLLTSNRFRMTHSYWCRDPATNRTVHCQPPLQPKPHPPGNVRIWKSSAYGAFSRAFVIYMLKPGGFGLRLYDWFSDTLCPEEHYFATLVSTRNAPGGLYKGRKTRAVQWLHEYLPCGGRYVRNVCIFRSADLPKLVTSPFAFANKFYFQDDPVAVGCLVESVLRRKSRPYEAQSQSLQVQPERTP